MTNKLSRSARRRFWENHVAQFRATSLSQAEYCRRNKISLKSFQYWKRKAKQNGSVPALVELTLPKTLPAPLLPFHPQLCLVVGQRVT